MLEENKAPNFFFDDFNLGFGGIQNLSSFTFLSFPFFLSFFFFLAAFKKVSLLEYPFYLLKTRLLLLRFFETRLSDDDFDGSDDDFDERGGGERRASLSFRDDDDDDDWFLFFFFFFFFFFFSLSRMEWVIRSKTFLLEEYGSIRTDTSSVEYDSPTHSTRPRRRRRRKKMNCSLDVSARRECAARRW